MRRSAAKKEKGGKDRANLRTKIRQNYGLKAVTGLSWDGLGWAELGQEMRKTGRVSSNA